MEGGSFLHSMPTGIAITAPGSGSGKTMLTTALLYSFKERGLPVRPFKVGPDYIDPLFHRAITGTPSINLDSYLMDGEGIRYLYRKYGKDGLPVVEGVMGYYDGMDRGSSTWDVCRVLGIPTILVLPAPGASHTIAALLSGLLSFRENTIAGVVLNRVGSESHYTLLKGILAQELPDIRVFGWIKNHLEGPGSRHLGLDTGSLDRDFLERVSAGVLEHVDVDGIVSLAEAGGVPPEEPDNPKLDGEILDPFPALLPAERDRLANQKLVVVNDGAFSFLYQDNLDYLKELFGQVTMVSALDDEEIPGDASVVYLPGGYVETPEIYPRLKRAHRFASSLRKHVERGGRVYGECAGLLYLGRLVEGLTGERMEMSGILPVDFRLRKTRKRLGYYRWDPFQGHSFHYTEPVPSTSSLAPVGVLRKPEKEEGEGGTWIQGKVCGTYLHSMFRNQPDLIRRFFLD